MAPLDTHPTLSNVKNMSWLSPEGTHLVHLVQLGDLYSEVPQQINSVSGPPECLRDPRVWQARARGHCSLVLGPQEGNCGSRKLPTSALNSGSPFLGCDIPMEVGGETRRSHLLPASGSVLGCPSGPIFTPSPTSYLEAIHFLSFTLQFLLLSLSTHTLLTVSSPE